MKPLSKNKRRGYFAFFFIVFIIGAPLFILHAKGYRINWGDVIKVSQTGGLYISTDQSGIAISVNNELVKKTSIVQKGIFVQDLKPGIYEIQAAKEGLQPWRKTLKVYPEIVTEVRAFLLTSKPELVSIPKLLDAPRPAATSSAKAPLRNQEYDAVNALFLPPAPKTTSAKLATTSKESETPNDMLIKNDKGVLRIVWMGEADLIPNYFCEYNTCKPEIVLRADAPILSFDFFPGQSDLLILRLENGIVVSEIDDRSPQNIQNIVSGPGYDFRVKDGKEIYIKKDADLYSVSL